VEAGVFSVGFAALSQNRLKVDEIDLLPLFWRQCRQNNGKDRHFLAAAGEKSLLTAQRS
jgi:hypothetical protein